MNMLHAMLRALPHASTEHCDKQCEMSNELAMHGRTDGRTNGEIGYASTNPHVPTRAGAYKISTDDNDDKPAELASLCTCPVAEPLGLQIHMPGCGDAGWTEEDA